MGGRGRGRGRGGDCRTFNREQMNALGITGSNSSDPLIEPPCIYRPLKGRPLPLESSEEMDYLLLVKQNLLHRMQIDAENFEKSMSEWTDYDWSLVPNELRPKKYAKRTKGRTENTIDLAQTFKKLEKFEDKQSEVKTEPIDNEANDETIEQEDEQDEEMDFGTDYADNYFDSGDEYNDEDNNLDNGPIY